MLKARVITALILLAGFLAMLFMLPFYGWWAFSSVVAGMGAWEWGGLMGQGRFGRLCYAFVSMTLSLVLGLTVFDFGSGAIRQMQVLSATYFLTVLFWLMVIPAWLKARWALSPPLTGMLTGWIVLIPPCVALMQLRTTSPLLLLAVVAAVWVADITAYFCGRAFGRTKLAPSISPGKTWEGAAGAMIGVLLYGFLISSVAGRLPNTAGSIVLYAAILIVLTMVSILGDLFESLIKRQAGVKDSGALLPGHGGILDRIDSLTSTLPLVGLALLALDGRLT